MTGSPLTTPFFSARMSRLLNARLSRRVIACLCAAWLAVTLLPLFAVAFYAHPAYDDFLHTLGAAEAWARTGSVGAAFAKAWERMALMYQTWQGTFVAMFVSALQPMVFSARLFFVTPLLTLGALLLSAAYFVKALVRRTFKADRETAVIVYTALVTLLLQFAPGLGEVIYWQSGTPYTLSVTAIFLMLGLMLKLRDTRGAALKVWRCAALLLSGAVLGGCPYPLALSGLVGVVVLAAWCFLRRSPARAGSLVALAGVAASLLVVLLAPGNAVRQARVGEHMGPVVAIVQSLAEAAETTGQWFSPQLVAMVSLATVFLWKPIRESGLCFRHPVWWSVFSFGVLAAGFVPPIYATGVEGYKIERILTSLYMLYVILTALNLVYWLGWLSHREEKKGACVALSGAGAPVWALLLCAGLLVWGMFACAIMTTPCIATTKSLLDRQAARFDAEMTRREQGIATADSREEAVSHIDTLENEPTFFPRDLLPFQKDRSTVDVMYRYYRMQALCEEYGAGRVPQAEWEALDAWTEE